VSTSFGGIEGRIDIITNLLPDNSLNDILNEATKVELLNLSHIGKLKIYFKPIL
jgi:hypothetical protein